MARVAGSNSYYTWRLVDQNGKVVDGADIRLASVTAVIKATLAKPALLEWYWRKGVEAAAIAVGASSEVIVVDDENSMTTWDYLSDPDILGEWIRENKLAPADQANDRAEEGTEAHEYFEKCMLALIHAEGTNVKLPSPTNGFEQGVLNWIAWARPEVRSCEQKVRSLRHGYAGTLDLAVEGKITDLKSRGFDAQNKPLGAYDADFIQVGAYKGAYEEMHGAKNLRTSVLVVRPDGSYDEYEGKYDDEPFLHLLQVYRILRGGGV